MVDTLEESALRSFLTEKKSGKQLVIDPKGISFRPLTFSEKLGAFLGIGRASFKNIVRYITNNIELIENESVSIQFHIRIAEWNARSFTWNKIPPLLINSLDPFRAIQKTIAEENIPLLKTLLEDLNIDISDPFQETALHKACRKGSLGIVQFLLSRKAAVNATSYHGETPLHLACYTKQLPVIQTLIENGANINRKDNKGKTPLIISCALSDLPSARFLIEKGASLTLADHQGRTPLHHACENEAFEVVELLLQQGADVSLKDEMGEIPLHKACEKNNKEIVSLLITKNNALHFTATNRFGKTAFQYAEEKGMEGIAQLLLKPPVGNNDSYLKQKKIEKTPLQIACKTGDSKLLEQLLEKGENINSKDPSGETALHVACANKDAMMVQILLQKGANPNFKDRLGKIPLLEAYEKDEREIVFLLLDSPDINVDRKDAFSNTLLHKACEKGDQELVECLLSKNADVNIKNELELTPLLIASEKDAVEIVSLLLQKGANKNVQNAFGRTPLEIAEAHDNKAMMKLLQ